MGEYGKSLEDALKSLSLSPTWSKAYFRAGESLLHLKRGHEANEYFLKGLEFERDSVDLKKGLEDAEFYIRNEKVIGKDHEL